MNDEFAVDLFSFENLSLFLQSSDDMSVYYCMPFVYWYGGIAISKLSREMRQMLLEIDRSRTINPGNEAGISSVPRKHFVEKCGLRRDITTVIFLYQPIKAHDAMTLPK
jgi:hypothetical protein